MNTDTDSGTNSPQGFGLRSRPVGTAFHLPTSAAKAPADWRTPSPLARFVYLSFFHPCLSVFIRGGINFFLALERRLSMVVSTPHFMTARNQLPGRLLFTSVLFLALAWLSTSRAGTNETARGPDILRATLTNGLQVIIVRNTLAPVVTTMINYLAGADECPTNFPGMAHATEHMMFRGSPDLSADQLADISAAMGGDFDADTQHPVTQYFFTTPADDLDVALQVEAARMRDLLPDESLWDKERGAIEQEVAQDLSNPEYVFYIKLLAAMFKGTPYDQTGLGTRPSFD